MQVEIHHHVIEDLAELRKTHRDEALEIIEVLSLLQSNPDIAECLYREHQRYDPPSFETKRYLDLYKKGYNAYRIKTLERSRNPSHRVLYVCDMRIDTAYILAVVPRSFNYDPQHPTVRRFLQDCEDIGIPQYR